jgi:hypothetical protein
MNNSPKREHSEEADSGPSKLSTLERFMRRREAGKYLQDNYGHGSEKTLAKLACLGGGPESTSRGVEWCSTPVKPWTHGRARKSADPLSRPPNRSRLEEWSTKMRRDPPACVMRPAAPRYRCWAA